MGESMPFYSPLRYPGGKRKLANFAKLVLIENRLLDGHYVEPYAGGASIALELLFEEFVSHVHINDIDPGVYAFWHSVLHDTTALCRKIATAEVNMNTWARQREIHLDPRGASMLELGFSTLFLNRTNRSGIVLGGVIGGKEQKGSWSLTARWNPVDLIARIERIAKYKDRILLSNLDASEFLQRLIPSLPQRSLVFMDPPYYSRGRKLYTNVYSAADHEAVSELVRGLPVPWIVSYDDCPEVRLLYDGYRSMSYHLHYSAANRYKGREVMFFSDHLSIPAVSSPVLLPDSVYQRSRSGR